MAERSRPGPAILRGEARIYAEPGHGRERNPLGEGYVSRRQYLEFRTATGELGERRVQGRTLEQLAQQRKGTVELRRHTAEMRWGGRLLGHRVWWVIEGTGGYEGALHLAPWAEIQARIVQYTAGRGKVRMVTHAFWLLGSDSPAGPGWRSSSPMEARQLRAAAIAATDLDDFLGRFYQIGWTDVYDFSFDEVKR